MTTKLSDLNSHNFTHNSHLPYVIAGPCSAESKEQILTIAEALSNIPQVKMMRCGIWKPRTRPNGFEGVGEKGLQWLKEAKERFNMPFCVEVAKTEHIEACLKVGIDAIWIGARTTVNPFSVQELANALRGTHLPVMVKNPMNPDLKLWVGALERFYDAGCENLSAIHRGFHVFKNDLYRNNPMWEVAIELKRIVPQLPIICDPSHIGGKRSLLKPLSQMALNMGFEGLMIEVHPTPDTAKTDAEQQITPAEFEKLLSELIYYTANETKGSEEIQRLRAQIDTLDRDLIETLAKRMAIVHELGSFKKENRMTILQMRRWEKILEDRLQYAQNNNLSRDFIQRLMEIIHIESIRIQNEE